MATGLWALPSGQAYRRPPDHSLVASSSLQTSPQRPDVPVRSCLLAFSRVCASELGQPRCGAVRRGALLSPYLTPSGLIPPRVAHNRRLHRHRVVFVSEPRAAGAR